jgi:hypothetical protein
VQKRVAHESVFSATCYPDEFKNPAILAYDSLNGIFGDSFNRNKGEDGDNQNPSENPKPFGSGSIHPPDI